MNNTYTGAILDRAILGQMILGTVGEPRAWEDLIFDRTQSDVDNKTAKGHYNADDLNRVERVVRYISDLMAPMGYIVPSDAGRIWEVNSLPRATETKRYCADVIAISKLIAYGSNLTIPTSLDKLTYRTANNIERVLYTVGKCAENIPQTWKYCGIYESGGF